VGLALAAVDENLIPLVAIVGGLTVAAMWMTLHYVSELARTKAREATRREVAAYVAEGSISPEDAVALLTAGDESDLAQAMAAMGASPKKIERMVAATRRQS
jgi:hypothetical protein